MTDTALSSLRITICGIEELARHGAAGGVTHIVSILDPGWPDPEALRAFAVHRRLKLSFHDVIEAVPGWIAPERWDVELLLAFAGDLRRARAGNAAGPWPAHLLIHCHAGVSRSTAAAILILAQDDPNRPAAEAVREVARLRPRAWPNLRMIEIGDGLLRRRGEIVAATRVHYRAALEREPGLAEAMIGGGRGREVAAAGL